MFYLETTRLILVQTPLEVLLTRLNQPTFTAAIPLPSGTMHVTFPAEWPGAALVLFPLMIKQYQHTPRELAWGGTIIDRTSHVAVGQMGCISQPKDGVATIGYGINPTYQNRGYATEMVQALTNWILTQPMVSRVTAECRTDNNASIRVLEKAHFVRIGHRIDDEEGSLWIWEQADTKALGR